MVRLTSPRMTPFAKRVREFVKNRIWGFSRMKEIGESSGKDASELDKMYKKPILSKLDD